MDGLSAAESIGNSNLIAGDLENANVDSFFCEIRTFELSPRPRLPLGVCVPDDGPTENVTHGMRTIWTRENTEDNGDPRIIWLDS
jgi:hypothetical protein